MSNNRRTMRAAIYCRVSSDRQVENLSLPTQEEACREYCRRHGYDVDRTYIDAGESAKTTDRPEFRRMLEHCRKGRGQIHAVVVYSLTRFSRNTADHHAIVTLVRGLGIALRSVTEPIDDTPSGRLMEGILASMAQFDNDVRAERVVTGMKAAVQRGRWVWPAPLGYINSDARRGPSLVPDPERAPLVRAAFELAASGVNGRDLVERLHAMGLRSRRGNTIGLSRIYDLLRHPAYAGFLRSATWETDVRSDSEPLTSEQTFAVVQARLSQHRGGAPDPPKHRDHPDFPLRRFVRCDACGKGVSGSWSRGKRGQRFAYYHCKAGCSSVPKARLEGAFVELLNQLRPRPEYWRLLRAAVLDVWQATKRQASANRSAIGNRIAGLNSKLARLDQAYLYNRTVDDQTYRAQRDQLREAIALEQLALNEAQTVEMDVEGMLAFAEHALEHAGALWSGAQDLPTRLQIQQAMFPEGLVWDQKLEHFVRPRNCLKFFELPAKSRNEVLSGSPRRGRKVGTPGNVSRTFSCRPLEGRNEVWWT